jgi:hypothetical protein
MEKLNDPPPNVLDQLASYNSTNLDNYILKLKNTLKEQGDLNTVLSTKDHDENIKYVTDFIEINKNQILFQLDDIKNLTKQIQDVCLDNERIENEKEEYKALIESPECKEIASKLKEIKKAKEDMNSFLVLRGIHLSVS